MFHFNTFSNQFGHSRVEIFITNQIKLNQMWLAHTKYSTLVFKHNSSVQLYQNDWLKDGLGKIVFEQNSWFWMNFGNFNWVSLRTAAYNWVLVVSFPHGLRTVWLEKIQFIISWMVIVDTCAFSIHFEVFAFVVSTVVVDVAGTMR